MRASRHYWRIEEVLDNPFDVLGVSTRATPEEIEAAWKSRAKKFHPDLYPDLPPEILHKLNEEMAKINAAHELLASDLEGARRRFSTFSADPTGANPNSNSRGGNAGRNSNLRDMCECCGSVNTDEFRFQTQTGLIISRRIREVNLRLCRNCAQAIGRIFQSRTLFRGWWGPVSAFMNLGYIYRNALELNKARKMDPPNAPKGFRTTPLIPGRSVFLRPTAWIGPIIIASLAIAIAASQPKTPPTSSVQPWSVGSCIRFQENTPQGQRWVGVDCSLTHGAVITAIVNTSEECPAGTVMVFGSSPVYCATLDQ